MHRLAELLKIYQQCNNIRYNTVDDTDSHKSINKEMRDALVEKLMQGESLNETEIKKILQKHCKEKIKSINSYAQDEEITAIKPFAHKKAFAGIPTFWKLSLQEQDKLIEFIADPLDTQAKLVKLLL